MVILFKSRSQHYFKLMAVGVAHVPEPSVAEIDEAGYAFFFTLAH